MEEHGRQPSPLPTAIQPKAPDLDVKVEPKYDEEEFWIILPTHGGTPRALRNPPQRLNTDEVELKLLLRVPKTQRRVAQTIRVTMPVESAHVAQIDVAVPKVEEVAR
jgi:hypothetical protein